MVDQKSVFVRYLKLSNKLESLNKFPGRFMNYKIFELSSSFVAHSDKHLGELKDECAFFSRRQQKKGEKTH